MKHILLLALLGISFAASAKDQAPDAKLADEQVGRKSSKNLSPSHRMRAAPLLKYQQGPKGPFIWLCPNYVLYGVP